MEGNPDFRDRSIVSALWRERYLILATVAVTALVVAYKFLFPPVSIDKDRLQKYEKVIADFNALTDQIEAQRSEGLRAIRDGGTAALDVKLFKTRLYQLFDYMYVWEMREDSPFFSSFPPQEKKAIADLQKAGALLDAAVIESGSYGNTPDIRIDIPQVRKLVSDAAETVKRERAGK